VDLVFQETPDPDSNRCRSMLVLVLLSLQLLYVLVRYQIDPVEKDTESSCKQTKKVLFWDNGSWWCYWLSVVKYMVVE